MPKPAHEIIATWPKWKRESAGFKEACKMASKEVSTWPEWKQAVLESLRIKEKTMKKSLSEQIVEQFKLAIQDKKLTQTEIGIKMGATPASVSRMLSKKENLTTSTIERLAAAIGGEIEIRFIPSKTELELLREENERLKKQLSARRYVENGTLNKR